MNFIGVISPRVGGAQPSPMLESSNMQVKWGLLAVACLGCGRVADHPGVPAALDGGDRVERVPDARFTQVPEGDGGGRSTKTPDAAPRCDPGCTGECCAGRCLVKLADVPIPGAIALYESDVYFSSYKGFVAAVSKSGGAVRDIVHGEREYGIAPGSGAVYLLTPDSDLLKFVPGAENPLTTILSRLGNVYTFTVDANRLYWSTDEGTMTANLDGTTPKLFATGAAMGIVLDDTFAYLASFNPLGVIKVPLEGGKPTTLFSGGFNRVEDIAVDQENLYFTDNVYVFAVSLSGKKSPQTLFGPRDLGVIAGLLVDGTNAYAGVIPNKGGQGTAGILKAPLDAGGAPENICPGKGARSLAVDDASIYFTDDNGIYKLTPK